MRLHNIGDIIAFRGRPENENPYRKAGLCGEERLAALLAFARGEAGETFTFWHAPFSGGARQVTADEIDWETCRGGVEARALAGRVCCEECAGRGEIDGKPGEPCFNCNGKGLVKP